MKPFKIILLSVAACWLLPAASALAVGTLAGTPISNQASVSFVVDSTTINQNSNEVVIEVAEVLDVTVQWQDTSNILVEAGETGTVATFLVTNTGNGSEAFSLTVDNNLGGDQFDPTLSAIYLDANGNGQYDAGVDTLYTAGSNDPVLAADGDLSVFVINDVPAGVTDGDLGDSQLSAAATTGTTPGTPGTVFAGAGDGGVNAVIGATGGAGADQATLQVSSVNVAPVKSATVVDPYGGSEPMPGATITYSIAVTASGSALAESVTVTDSVPQYTTYVAGSLQLDGVGLTDAADGDAGAVSGGNISVQLGDLQDITRTVTFQVTID